MKVLLVILAALAALMVPTAALASHGGGDYTPPTFTAKTFCVAGVNHSTPATFLGALEAAALDAAAAHGGYWALPNGLPFIDQTPSATAISYFHLKFVTVAKGTCAVAPQISSSFVCQSRDNRENPSLQLAPNAAAFLKSGWHNPVAVPGNYGGTVIGTARVPYTLHCGGIPTSGYVDFGGDLFGANPAFVGVPGMYPLGVG